MTKDWKLSSSEVVKQEDKLTQNFYLIVKIKVKWVFKVTQIKVLFLVIIAEN